MIGGVLGEWWFAALTGDGYGRRWRLIVASQYPQSMAINVRLYLCFTCGDEHYVGYLSVAQLV